MKTPEELANRYRDELQLYYASNSGDTRRGVTDLVAIEQEILAAHADEMSDGIDPILLISNDLDSPLATWAFKRRCEQIKTESGEDVLPWVIDRTSAEHKKITSIGVARVQLLIALDQIVQSLDEAEAAVKTLDNNLDLQIISGPANPMLAAAFTHIRLLAAGAATYAPKLEG